MELKVADKGTEFNSYGTEINSYGTDICLNGRISLK